YVLDGEQEAVGRGIEGEIWGGGGGGARGYVNDAVQTAERFLPDEWSGVAGGGVYRCGYKGRAREGGAMENAGRGDGQVKIRGYRIELGESEAVLNEQEGVKQSAVVMKGEGGEKRLVGYVELRGGTRVEEVKRNLKRKLPEYMVPVKMVEVEGIGLTAHGK